MITIIIVSVISVLVVMGVTTTYYVQNRSREKLYDKKMQEYATKINSAHQYEYEANQDQENSLDKVRNDVLKYNDQIVKISKDFDYIKKQQSDQINNLNTNYDSLKSLQSSDINKVTSVNNEQDTKINTITTDVSGLKTDIKTANDKITVINGQLVNIGEKQQTAINSLITDNTKIKTDQGTLRDTVYSVKNDYISKFNSVLDTTTLVKTNVDTLNNSFNTLSNSINKYVLTTDADKTYAKNATLNNYVTSADYNAFKATIPEVPTKTQLNALVGTYVTQSNLTPINNSISDNQKALNEMKTTINIIQTNYSKLSESMLLNSNSQGNTSINVNALNATLQAYNGNLQTMNNTITAINNSNIDFKNTVGNTYALKTTLDGINTNLQGQINTLKAQANITADNITANKLLYANGDVVLNNIKFSNGWTGYPDNAADKSEIANDKNGYKKLMIVGNKSGGAERRVGVLDRLDVHGNLGVDAAANIGGNLTVNGNTNFQNNGSGVAWGNPTNPASKIYDNGHLNIDTDDVMYMKAPNSLNITTPNANINGKLSTTQGISVTNPNPGVLIDKNYGRDSDRYGVGQFDGGATRVYSATNYPPATVNLSLAKDNNQFDDILTIKNDRSTNINGPLNVNDKTKANKIQLGDKFLLSGVGDAHDDDGWLRLFNKDGTGYYGGIAVGELWSGSTSYLNGNTNINGPLNVNANARFQNNGSGITWGNPENPASKIYDNGHLNIDTDDVMYMNAPNSLNITTPTTNISGEVKANKMWTHNLAVDGDLYIDNAGGDGWFNHITKKDDKLIINKKEDLNNTNVDRNGITIAPWNGAGGMRVHGGGVNINGDLRLNKLGVTFDRDWDGQPSLSFDGETEFRIHGRGGPNAHLRVDGNIISHNNVYSGNGATTLGADGTVSAKRLCLGPRWCIQPEGDVLVFRDNGGKNDNRYAMFPNSGNNKNL